MAVPRAEPTVFVCLGFPKCGTTALFEIVEAHAAGVVALRHPVSGTTEVSAGAPAGPSRVDGGALG